VGLGVLTQLFTIYWPDYRFPWPECRHSGSSNCTGTISNASTIAQRELKSSKIEEIDLPAKHLDYFIWSHKSSINQSQSHVCAQPCGCRNRDHQKITRVFICRLTKHYMSYKALYDTLSWVCLHHCVCKRHTWANMRRCLPGRRGFAEARLAGRWCHLMVGWIRLFFGDEEACGLFFRAGLHAAHVHCQAGFYAARTLHHDMLACYSTFMLHWSFCLSFCECSRCARPLPCALPRQPVLRALHVPPFLQRLTRHNRWLAVTWTTGRQHRLLHDEGRLLFARQHLGAALQVVKTAVTCKDSLKHPGPAWLHLWEN